MRPECPCIPAHMPRPLQARFLWRLMCRRVFRWYGWWCLRSWSVGVIFVGWECSRPANRYGSFLGSYSWGPSCSWPSLSHPLHQSCWKVVSNEACALGPLSSCPPKSFIRTEKTIYGWGIGNNENWRSQGNGFCFILCLSTVYLFNWKIFQSSIFQYASPHQ